MSEPDYYAILRVSPDATPEAIQSAYRSLSKQYHPDTGQPAASAAVMQRINEAYAVLADAEARARYDAAYRRSRPRPARGHHADASGRTARGARPNVPRWAHAVRAAVAAILDLAPGLSLPLARVQAGDFLMGGCPAGTCADLEREACRAALYTLTLPEYYIGIYPVTVDQYAAFVAATGRRSTLWARRSYSYDPDELDDLTTVTRLDRTWQHPFGAASGIEGKEDHPVFVVDWFDAVAFCEWASQVSGAEVRLPTVAEWQGAARGRDGRCYPWGDAPAPHSRLCNCLAEPAIGPKTPEGDTTPAGAFSPQGDSPFGCADMLGNVWEWTSTIAGRKDGTKVFGDPYRPDDGREDPQSRDPRVLLGGSFQTRCAVLCSHARRALDPLRAQDTGFRVCVSSR